MLSHASLPLPAAHKVFNGDGALQDPKRHAAVIALGSQLAQMASALGTATA